MPNPQINNAFCLTSYEMECDLEIETLIGGILTQTLRMILLKQVMNVQFQKDLSSQLKRLSLIIWLAHLTDTYALYLHWQW